MIGSRFVISVLRMAAIGATEVYAAGLQRLGYFLSALALIAGVAVWLWRKFSFGRSSGPVNRRLKIEESKMLGYKQHLVVAEYEGRKFLLGVCPGRIDFLCRLDEGNEDFHSVMGLGSGVEVERTGTVRSEGDAV